MTMTKYGKRCVAIKIMETVGARPTQVAQQLIGALAKKLSSADLERLLHVVRNPDRGQPYWPDRVKNSVHARLNPQQKRLG